MRLKGTAFLLIALLVAQASAAEAPLLKTEKDKVSYGIGVDVARHFKQQGIEFDLDLVIKGLRDAASGQKLLMPEAELRKTLTTVQTDLRRKQALIRRAPAEANKKKGEAFLADNKTQNGVVTLPSGLQYKILKAGDGKKPTYTNTVECHYRGTLIDGTQFISTQPGQPATFKVREAIIPAWIEALPLMPVGSKWKLFVPPQLGYGARAVGTNIGPNETLIFDLELLAIK
jgi:FKBP-type peptidyl-prolyl cis-trans isomerase FklB